MKLGNHINDRIGEFLVGHLDSYIFDELSDDFLKKNGFFEILSGVPVPVRKDDMVNLFNQENLHKYGICNRM